MADVVGELETVHGAGHVNIGEHQAYIWTPLQYFDRGVGVGSFKRLEARVFDHIDCSHPDENLVLNNQNWRSLICHVSPIALRTSAPEPKKVAVKTQS